MKLFAVFDKLPDHDRVLTGLWHYLNLPSGHVLFVCAPKNYGKGEKHLQDLKGIVFPDLIGRENVPEEIHAHAAFKDVGLLETDTTYSAAKKLAEKFGWVIADPR
jgi:hypothetical protein